MTSITKAGKKQHIDHVIRSAEKKVESLRAEIENYRNTFESIRLVAGHEFIKPLASIRGYIELLESELGDVLDEKQKRYFFKAQTAVQRIEELIDSFIRMLLLESEAEWVQDLEVVDLCKLIDSIVGRIDGNAAEVVNAVDAGMPKLRMNRKSMEIVLENLITNAVYHGKGSEPVRITATMRRERRGSSKDKILMIKIEDHGPGIPENDLNNVFDLFYRGGYSNSTPGLGLGLALVGSILKILKGKIHISSKPEEGTMVTLTVPISGEAEHPPVMVG